MVRLRKGVALRVRNVTAVVGLLLGTSVVMLAADELQVQDTDTAAIQQRIAEQNVLQPEMLGDELVPGQTEAEQRAIDGVEERNSYLIHFSSNKDAFVQRGSVIDRVTKLGGYLKYEYQLLPDVVNVRDVSPEALAEIAAMPGVERIERDEYYPHLVKLEQATPLIRGLQSQITGAGLSATGAGVRIAIVDTGIDSDHIMYSTRIDTAAGHDFYNDDSNPEDDNGHGSHVAGIAAGGTGLNVNFGCPGSVPFQGVAPEATLIGVKVLNSGGGGFSSDIIAGIDYAADQSANGGRADVINLSIGTGQYSSACTHSWAVAANNAVANGVVVVAASGNENYANALSSPACGSSVIAVGATYADSYPSCEVSTSTWNWGICTDVMPAIDSVVCFSNESDNLDVTAPGCLIYSASNDAGGSSIVGECGTSMASPMVAGLAALILSADPSLTPAEVRTIIRQGAIDMGPNGFDRAYGYGRIDVINSLMLVGGPPANNPPTANAGSDQTVTDSDDNGSENVTLNGTGSSDSDGTIVDYTWREGVNVVATGATPTVSFAVGVHTIVLTVTDDDSATDTDTVVITVEAGGGQPTEETFISIASEDGRMRETSETSNNGGSLNTNNSGNQALRAGDSTSDRQWLTILSFDTSSIPDGATIVSAELRLYKNYQTGSVSNLGSLVADIKLGTFGSAALESFDFAAAADGTAVVTLNVPGGNGWSEGSLNGTGLAAINKTGRTQFRVRFTLDDNDDGGNDYIGFRSGDSASNVRPQLVITYQ